METFVKALNAALPETKDYPIGRMPDGSGFVIHAMYMKEVKPHYIQIGPLVHVPDTDLSTVEIVDEKAIAMRNVGTSTEEYYVKRYEYPYFDVISASYRHDDKEIVLQYKARQTPNEVAEESTNCIKVAGCLRSYSVKVRKAICMALGKAGYFDFVILGAMDLTSKNPRNLPSWRYKFDCDAFNWDLMTGDYASELTDIDPDEIHMIFERAHKVTTVDGKPFTLDIATLMQDLY